MKLGKWTVGLGLAASTWLGSAEAEAFCGFYVSGADAKLFNNATQVVLMRDGIRTVLSMQNDYEGPPSAFAMVVPVPVVLQEENVKTLPREIFAKVDQLAAPRLVEYWEQDPCAVRARPESMPAPAAAAKAARSMEEGASADYGVKIEAQFSVGEYEIVILSAEDSGGLDRWLRDNQYKIPEGAEPVLRPYVAANMKFFVAKVNTDKVTFETVDGKRRAKLSPLRFHYDDDRFSLPVRLGLLNSGGTQDLIVHVLSPRKRYEVANYPNVTIPTNIDLDEKAIDKFGAFYADLFDRTLEKNPKAVVTEYAWDSASCDPCPTPPLQHGELMTLGADVIAGDDASRPRVPIVTADFSKSSGVSQGWDDDFGAPRPRRGQGMLGPIRACYAEVLAEDKAAEGKVEVSYQVGPQQTPTGVAVRVSGKLPAKLGECVKSRSASMNLYGEAPGPGKLAADLRSIPQPPSMNFVLTRLHARYTKDSLGEDLVFREAPAIAGGREFMSEGKKLERGASVVRHGQNNFQGRYAIRHLWDGPIKCDNPVRGVWGGPPAGKQQKTQSALDLAFAPRGKTDFASLVVQDVPEIGLTGVGPGRVDPVAYQRAKRKAKEAAEAAAGVTETGAKTDVPPEGGGCGCVVAGGGDHERGAAGVFAALAAAFAYLGRRRRS
jgi:hypothetical protein